MLIQSKVKTNQSNKKMKRQITRYNLLISFRLYIILLVKLNVYYMCVFDDIFRVVINRCDTLHIFWVEARFIISLCVLTIFFPTISIVFSTFSLYLRLHILIAICLALLSSMKWLKYIDKNIEKIRCMENIFLEHTNTIE